MFDFLKKEVVIKKWVEFQFIYVQTNKATYYHDYEGTSIRWYDLSTGIRVRSTSSIDSILDGVYEMYHHDALVAHRLSEYEKEKSKDEKGDK